jgi:reactive chlorine resistance protein C
MRTRLVEQPFAPVTTRTERESHAVTVRHGERVQAWGGNVMRGGLGLIFLWFGCMTFTSYEATGIAPFIMNSPLMGWWHSLLGIQGASTMLGIFEITTGILLALCQIAPRASVVGGAMAVFTFLITLSFFLTTPGVAAPMGFPAISGHIGQFLLKDAGLLGISIWLFGGALVAMTTHAAKTPNTASRYGCKTL